MPPILIAFIIAQGLAHGPNLVKTTVLTPYKDPMKREVVYGKKTAVEYRAWTGPRWRALEKNGACKFVLFVRVTGRGSTRMRINGTERLVDESWSQDYTIKQNKRATILVEWMEPRTGVTITEREVDFDCALPALEGDTIEAYSGDYK